MPDVVSFRPSAEEARVIEATRRQLRLKSRSDAVRYLVMRAGQDSRKDATEAFFAMRAPEEFRQTGRSVTAEEIDEEVYGKGARDDADV